MFVSCLQEDLTAPSELSGSKDNLSVNTKVRIVKAEKYFTKFLRYGKNLNYFLCNFLLQESGGVFGMFKKSPKPLGTRTKSQVRVLWCCFNTM